MARKALQLVGGALAIALLTSPASAWNWDWDNDREYSRVVAFGDSFTDTGNRFQYNDEDGPWGLTWRPCLINDWNVTAPPGFPPELWDPDAFDGLCPVFPDDVYSNTFTFTNGRNYVQQVATELGVPYSAGPAWLGRNWFRIRSNYAIGGAPASSLNDTKVVFPGPNLQGEVCDSDMGECPDRSVAVQVEKFLTQFRGNAPSDALYIFGIGSRDALTVFQRLGQLAEEGNLFVEPGVFTQDANEEIAARFFAAYFQIRGSLETLCEAGANTIVIVNIPNISVSPAIPEDAKLLGTLVASLFNLGLDPVNGITGIEDLAANPPGACADPSKTILLVDLFALTNRYLFEDPTLINPATGGPFERGTCLQQPDPAVPFGYFDEPCDRYFIFDYVHPTSSSQTLIANELLGLIGH